MDCTVLSLSKPKEYLDFFWNLALWFILDTKHTLKKHLLKQDSKHQIQIF